MELELINNLAKESQERFSTKKEHHDFLMFHIQHHLVEINDLMAKKDSHCKCEMVDLVILCHMLAHNEEVDSKLFKERIAKFKSKIKDSE